MSVLAAFGDLSASQLMAVAGAALITSVIGGVTGYGTGALMPLVLVPIVGAEPVVPIIAIASLLTNSSRALAFRAFIDGRRAAIVLAGAIPPCILTAYGYTRLTDKGAMLVIGAMLIATVPFRRLLKRYNARVGTVGLVVGGAGYGTVVGGTAGAGVILLSLLMAGGLEGAAVIATDAVISIAVGAVKMAVFGVSGVINAQVLALALLIGLVAFPGAFLARTFVERLPLRAHTAILDAVVLAGGAVMIIGAVAR
jgi:uncharacterized membrane protein YfcA